MTGDIGAGHSMYLHTVHPIVHCTFVSLTTAKPRLIELETIRYEATRIILTDSRWTKVRNLCMDANLLSIDT